jgi:hypothetical protein
VKFGGKSRGEIHAGRLFIGHHSALRHRRGRSENNVRSPGDGPKAAYHPPSDCVKITYGYSLVTGDVRTLTLAAVAYVEGIISYLFSEVFVGDHLVYGDTTNGVQAKM